MVAKKTQPADCICDRRTEQDLIEHLKHVVQALRSKSAAAETFGVTGQYLGQVLDGKRPIAETLARAMGFQPVRMFIPIKPEGAK